MTSHAASTMLFNVAAGVYVGSFFSHLLKRYGFSCSLLGFGFVLHTASLVIRCWRWGIFSLDGVFNGALFLPWCLAFLALIILMKGADRGHPPCPGWSPCRCSLLLHFRCKSRRPDLLPLPGHRRSFSFWKCWPSPVFWRVVGSPGASCVAGRQTPCSTLWQSGALSFTASPRWWAESGAISAGPIPFIGENGTFSRRRSGVFTAAICIPTSTVLSVLVNEPVGHCPAP